VFARLQDRKKVSVTGKGRRRREQQLSMSKKERGGLGWVVRRHAQHGLSLLSGRGGGEGYPRQKITWKKGGLMGVPCLS